MADWILIPCLVRLRTEFNLIAPARDRASDGSIGDTAHAGGGTSDHLPDEDFPALRGKDSDGRNEVHALDVDADLRTPGLTMEQVVQFLLGRCRSGAETRLRYIIFNRRIWEAANGWRQRAYSGKNLHTEHAHFSASYDSAREASTASWHLEDLVALTEEQTRDVVREELKAWAKIDPIASIFARTGWLANIAVPALAASVASLDTADVDEAELAARLAALIPDGLAQRVADELAARLHE